MSRCTIANEPICILLKCSGVYHITCGSYNRNLINRGLTLVIRRTWLYFHFTWQKNKWVNFWKTHSWSKSLLITGPNTSGNMLPSCDQTRVPVSAGCLSPLRGVQQLLRHRVWAKGHDEVIHRTWRLNMKKSLLTVEIYSSIDGRAFYESDEQIENKLW